MTIIVTASGAFLGLAAFAALAGLIDRLVYLHRSGVPRPARQPLRDAELSPPVSLRAE